MANFVVYSTPSCQRCNILKRAITAAGHTYSEVNAEEHKDEALSLGVGANLPIVVPPEGYGEPFSGVRLDRLRPATVSA